MTKIVLYAGDILNIFSFLKPPIAIVTSANPKLNGNAQPNHWLFRQYEGTNVDPHIRKAAGQELMHEIGCMKSIDGIRCPVGNAISSSAYDLRPNYDLLIHTVTPRMGMKNWKSLLLQCYAQSIQIARNKGMRSIAFPALGCGVHQLPPESVAPIAFDVCSSSELECGFALPHPEVFSRFQNLIPPSCKIKSESQTYIELNFNSSN